MIDKQIIKTFEYVDELLGRYKSLKKDLMEETLKRRPEDFDYITFVKDNYDVN